MAIVLKVQDLKKSYKRGLTSARVNALKGISFSIHSGTITGFLGANGAGKTTSIKCILNLAHCDEGTIEYFGTEGLSQESKARIGFLPERPYFYEYLTGREFLRFYGELSLRVKTVELKERIESLLKRVGLKDAGDRPLRSYSKGMLQRIGIAQSLIHEPELIILDEPMTGLDPDGRLEVREIIQETAKQGTAVFFSSHLLPDAEQICENLVILKLGQLVYDGTTEKLLNQVDAGFCIQYFENSRRSEERVPDLAQVQSKIDGLRKRGCEIVDVRATRLSLEEAFIRIGFDPKGPK